MCFAADAEHEIPDSEILELMNEGDLVMREHESRPIEVWKWHGGWHRYVKVLIATYDEDKRLRCNLRLKNRQRTIYLNKLVWMFANKKVVPDGFCINHINEVCTDDRLGNLELQTVEESNRQGRRLQYAVSQDDSFDYGEF